MMSSDTNRVVPNSTTIFQIRPELDLAKFRNSNLAGTGAPFTKTFSDHRTICLMKLTASTMLSAAIKGSTVQCFLCYITVCQFLTKYAERQ